MKALHYIDGKWHEGNPMIFGAMTHAAWMASVVFDGARAFEGITPDLDLHCERLIESAKAFGLKPVVSAGETLEIALDGVSRFENGAALYIRPMFWAEDGFVIPDPESTRFCCTLYESQMPELSGSSWFRSTGPIPTATWMSTRSPGFRELSGPASRSRMRAAGGLPWPSQGRWLCYACLSGKLGRARSRPCLKRSFP